MTLDIKSASILIECVRRGSLGRAASALNLTQPAVTRVIRLLEASYGVPLFERNTRGVVPTIYGEALLPYAKLLVSEAGNASDLIKQMRGASRGVVRVGGVSSVVGGLLVSAIREMRQQYPEVQFRIVEELEDRLLEGLKSGEIDLAISPEPYADDEIALAIPDALHDVVFVYTRADNPLLEKTELSLNEVARQNWALPPTDTPIVREWLRRFHSQAIEPNPPTIVSRSVQVIKSAAMTDDVLCWMPMPLVASEVKRGELGRVQVPALEWRRTFRVYRRKKGMMPPSVAILIQFIRRTAGHNWAEDVRQS
ncbi:LysR family transcriptional regulator [Chelativorans sp. J32]|uniref:LysR family transcriptional regulator n=1 Tax=Chelativorans sp. J32 TaxID=935840 RepID=UPI00048408FF|nr:LysR family transcriptional regulator [Chelativorans sp. J32]